MSALDPAFAILEQRMLGRRVTAARVFLFTLQVYLASDAEDAPDLEVWCEPSWHVRTAAGVLTGSGAIEGPRSYDDDAEVERASATITRAGDTARTLIGQSLTSLAVDAVTCALTAQFSGGTVVATFTDDANAEELWVLRDPGTNETVRGTALGRLEKLRG